MGSPLRAKASAFLSWAKRPIGKHRLRSVLSSNPDPLRIELGAWTTQRAGWVSTDVHWRGDCYLDATRTWPIKSNSVELVYADNVIEHLTFAQNQVVLRECLRVLKPGGRIRLVTPDIGELAQIYVRGLEASRNLRSELRQEGYEVHHQVDVLRFAFQDDGHATGYLWDEAALRVELNSAGFTDITVHEAGRSNRSDLCDLESRVGNPVADACIHIEASKPAS